MEINEIIGKILGCIAALSVVVEFVPVKINPITAVLKWIGKRTNQELEQKVDLLSKRVDELEVSDVVDCRVRILGFADEIRRGILHSKETFDQVMSDIDTYERYCDEHPMFKNNRTIAAKDLIIEKYHSCLDKNSFL